MIRLVIFLRGHINCLFPVTKSLIFTILLKSTVLSTSFTSTDFLYAVLFGLFTVIILQRSKILSGIKLIFSVTKT